MHLKYRDSAFSTDSDLLVNKIGCVLGSFNLQVTSVSLEVIRDMIHKPVRSYRFCRAASGDFSWNSVWTIFISPVPEDQAKKGESG